MSETLYLAHHGIKGQKWGVRRYQEEDGSLTPAGRVRYGGEGYVSQQPRKMSFREGYVSQQPRKMSFREAYRESAKQERAARAERIDLRKQANQTKGMDENTAYEKAVKQEKRENRVGDAAMGAAIGVGYQVVMSVMTGTNISLVGLALDAGAGAVGGMLGGAIGRKVVKTMAGE